MIQKYEERCWYCGSWDMEALGEYVRCRACGATWNEVPEAHSSPVTTEKDDPHHDNAGRTVTKGSPSAAVQRRAARARNASIKT